MAKRPTEHEAKQGDTPLLEWIAAGCGVLLLGTLVFVIGREAVLERAAEPPMIEMRAEQASATPSGYVVPFEAINRANGTAAAVEVEGVLYGAGQAIERSGATIDYVPGHGRSRGGLYFTHDPRTLSLSVRATGYQDP